MKIRLWSIGKAHENYVKEGVEDFTRRIAKYCPAEWKIFAAAKHALQKDDYLVLLDENGKQISSPQLASLLENCGNNSIKQLIFLIGGAFGVDEQIKSRANFTWSFSQLVFPHQLVRLMLAEQIYRACTIIRHEKYHHE